MATNPRGPSERPKSSEPLRPELVPSLKQPKSAVPGVLLAIVAAAALIAAIVYYMPRAPHVSPSPSAGQSPPQPLGNELQFSQLHMSAVPLGGAMRLQGVVINEGPRPVLGARAQLSFMGADGKVLQTVTRPLEGMTVKNETFVPDDWAKDPLKTGDRRPFEVDVDQVPEGWNHQLPSMTITTVASEGAR